jgi:cell division protein FtsB
MTNEQWHLSKSVPISIIGAVVVQTITIVWFIANLNANVQINTRDLVRHETRIETLEASVQSQAVSMARMDENIQAIRDMVEQLTKER